MPPGIRWQLLKIQKMCCRFMTKTVKKVPNPEKASVSASRRKTDVVGLNILV